MITLITGLPGASKTLYTLTYVKAWAEKDNRPVYYAGIKDLMLPWTEIDATKWFECPANSIIVIDECQTVFRPRSFGSNVPDFVARLETHRHQGLDIVLITQHPMLCDPSVRRLAGAHKHIVRKWGFAASTIHEWGSVRENCDKPAGRSDSIKHHWKFDKKSYGFYKSAEVHTVKRNLPFRVVLLFVVLPLAIAFLVYRFYSSVNQRVNPGASSGQAVSSSSQVPGQRREASGRVAAYADPVADARQFTFDRTPRVEGLPHTAPRYDRVTEPVTAPIPVSCIATSSKCKCYSQQGTFMAVRDQTCRDIVEFGYFVDFKDGAGREDAVRTERDRRERSTQALSRDDGLPMSGAQTRDVAPKFSAADGYGVLGKQGPGVRVPAL